MDRLSSYSKMSNYIKNPKTSNPPSGIVCCIPQSGLCPNACPECFFNDERGYLHPLADNLPNMPTLEQVGDCVVRVNDGHDSSWEFEQVLANTQQYPRRFYNTCSTLHLSEFIEPVVLTVNSGHMTEEEACFLHTPPVNLMFVRVRVNTWNLDLVGQAVDWYSEREVPIVFTFMAYHDQDTIPYSHRGRYILRNRTLNKYYAICTFPWQQIMRLYRNNKWVYSCGKIEGEKGDTHCRFCGNCLREYFATKERMASAE